MLNMSWEQARSDCLLDLGGTSGSDKLESIIVIEGVDIRGLP